MDQLDMFTQNWRMSDPITSVRAAAEVNATSVRSHKLALLVHYAKAGQGGLTNEEAGELSGLKAKGASYWRRCSDLLALGLIERTDSIREASSGKGQSVCVITDAGRAVLEGVDHGISKS